MDFLSGHVLTLANSIIGVSILAMPYCFKQCGVILSICILLISSIISRLCSHFLLKSAILARRKTFEFLAFHIFGSPGKFCIEIGLIGFLIGTCIAFFVVMGDLGPEIVSEMTGARTGNALRNSVLVALAVLCILPLGLLRNVDSLNGVSQATIGFYCCLVIKIMLEAFPHIFMGDWVDEVVLWRPQGILQCLPIFSMALFCQTQLFEIYQAIPNASLEKMNSLIRVAVHICTWVYIFVGAFGYIAFFQKPFSGNILLSFKPSIITDLMKIGFVLSIAFSFPLVIFPCRASLYSLLYKGPNYTSLHEGAAANYIPEGKFKVLTFVIIAVSLVVGIMIPNIELVLGLVGSTIGVMICVLFPVTCFICISPKNTNERILAQIMLFVGVIVMVLGSYANMYAFEEAKFVIVTESSGLKNEEHLAKVTNERNQDQHFLGNNEKNVVIDVPTTVKSLDRVQQILKDENSNNVPNKPELQETIIKDMRHEPPQPEEPNEIQPPSKPNTSNIKKEENNEVNKRKENNVVNKVDDIREEIKEKQGPVVEPVVPIEDKEENKPIIELSKLPEVIKEVSLKDEPIKNGNLKKLSGQEEVKKFIKKNDEVDIEAIKKEDAELKEQEKEKVIEVQEQNKILIDTIQKQNEVQKEIVEQQKKLIEVIQNQQKQSHNQDIEKIVKEEKIKAVQQIKDIAEEAIEKISGQDQDILKADSIKKGYTPKQPVDNVDKRDLKLPLSYQLGLNQEQKNDRVNGTKIKLLPLPIALGTNFTYSNDTKAKFPKVELKKSNNASEHLNAIGRDILSEKEIVRNKRDVAEIGNSNEVVREVCNDVKKLASTEKPIIKMLCKLSEPNLVNVNTNDVQLRPAVSVKSDKAKPDSGGKL